MRDILLPVQNLLYYRLSPRRRFYVGYEELNFGDFATFRVIYYRIFTAYAQKSAMYLFRGKL